jgi:hypothetical protein
MDFEKEAMETDKEVKAIVEAFSSGIDVTEMLNGVNTEEKVNGWIWSIRPYEMDYEGFFPIVPIVDFFHLDDDIFDYYDVNFFQDASDWHKLWTMNKMSPTRDRYDEFVSLERFKIDDLTLSVEVSSHGQYGLFFHNLNVFKTDACVIDHYKNKIYSSTWNKLLPKEGHFVCDGEKIISHSDTELLEFFELYIAPKLPK